MKLKRQRPDGQLQSGHRPSDLPAGGHPGLPPMRRLILIIAAMVATAAIGAATGSAAVRSCSYPQPSAANGGYGPRNDRFMNGGGVSVRNMSCSSALRAIANGYLSENGTPLRTRGFRCYVVSKSVDTVGHFVTGAVIRCLSGRRAFRFSWAT
jgi:hypothetical protein